LQQLPAGVIVCKREQKRILGQAAHTSHTTAAWHSQNSVAERVFSQEKPPYKQLSSWFETGIGHG
jgi:hypothetical protein